MNQPLPLHILHIIENPNDIFLCIYNGHGNGILILSKAVVWSGNSLETAIIAITNFFNNFILIFLHGLKSRMTENAIQQLGPSQSIC